MKKELKELADEYRSVEARTLTTLVEIRLNRRPSSKKLHDPVHVLKKAYWAVVEALEERLTFGELCQVHSFNPEWLMVALANLATIGKVRDVKRGREELTVWEIAPKSHDRALVPEKLEYFIGDIYL